MDSDWLVKNTREFYEVVVTAAYLSKHPEEVDLFYDYHPVHKRKALKNAMPDELKLYDLTQAQIDEVESQYQNVKEKYQENICKPCKKTRTRGQWSALTLPAMAGKTDPVLELASLYVTCYLFPTLYAHTTVAAVHARVTEKPGGGIRYDQEAQRGFVRAALVGSHNLILRVLSIQNIHFNLGLGSDIDALLADFMKAWPDKSVSPSQ